MQKFGLLLSCVFCFLPAFQLSAAGVRETDSGGQPGMAVLGETDTTITFREKSGNIVEIPKNPERVIVCVNSLLDIWYMAGGTSLARVKGTTNVPKEAENLPVLGGLGSLNTELIMELEPDLLIVSELESHLRVRDFFETEGVRGVAISYSNYDDFPVIFDLFARITGEGQLGGAYLSSIQDRIDSIIKQVPDTDPPTVCILSATIRSMNVETADTLTGNFCARLGAGNICGGMKPEGADRVRLNLEYILEQDPDVIFVTSMGDVEKCRERVERDIVSSDIWGELSAVKNERFYYLDKTWFTYKPNRCYPEAFRIIAEYLYPDVNFLFP